MDLIARLDDLAQRPARLRLPLHGDAPFELDWFDDRGDFDSFPELDDVADELDGVLVLAAARRGDTLIPILVAKAAPHPVSMFFEGFHELATSLEAFEGLLAAADAPDPRTLLRAALDEASARLNAKDFAGAVEGLEPALAPFGPGGAEPHPLAGLLAQAFTDLGFSFNALAEPVKAARAYELGASHGSVQAGVNLLRLHRDAGEWKLAEARARTLLASYKTPEDLTVVRGILAMALAALADEAGLAALEAEHTSYLAWLVGRDAEQARALRDRLCTTLSGSTLEPAAMTRLEPMVARLRALALAGTPKTVSERDVSSALDLIGKSAKLRFENLVKFKPDLARDERVKAAIAQMEEPGRAAFLAILASV